MLHFQMHTYLTRIVLLATIVTFFSESYSCDFFSPMPFQTKKTNVSSAALEASWADEEESGGPAQGAGGEETPVWGWPGQLGDQSAPGATETGCLQVTLSVTHLNCSGDFGCYKSSSIYCCLLDREKSSTGHTNNGSVQDVIPACPTRRHCCISISQPLFVNVCIIILPYILYSMQHDLLYRTLEKNKKKGKIF